MVELVFIFLFLSSINGFLLDSQNGNGQTGSSNQYLTVSAFIDAKTQQHNQIEQLRRDTNQMLNVLAAQLQDKLTLSEQKTGCNCNESQKVEQNYDELLRNHTTLQQYVEHLNSNFTVQQNELLHLRNKSNELNRELQDLKQLKNIQALQDFKALQHQVQSINSQTHSLSVNERARTQDFLALYNVTIESKTAISTLNRTMHGLDISRSIKFDKKIQSLNTIVNETTQRFTEQLDEVEHMSNATFVGLQNQISRNAEKVALTACLLTDEYNHSRPPRYIIKFSDMRNKVGINNLSSFTKNGKFTCEKDGLYLITVTFLTTTWLGRVGIYKNGSLLTATFSTEENNSKAYSSTAVAAVELLHGDSIWIQVDRRTTYIYVYTGKESCITIVKVM